MSPRSNALDRTDHKRNSSVALVTRVALMLTPALLQAQAPLAHVRPETPVLRALTAEASARSPIIHDMIDRLDQTDIVVYVRHRPFGSRLVDGRIGFLSAAGQRRYLVIELGCDRGELVQMATLGHELHHALEIAGEASIVDAETLERFYAGIGMVSIPMGNGVTFETQAAADTGTRVRHQLLTPTTRSANGS